MASRVQRLSTAGWVVISDFDTLASDAEVNAATADIITLSNRMTAVERYARGIVGEATMTLPAPVTITGNGRVANNINFTPLVGRKYTLSLSIRAIGSGAGGFRTEVWNALTGASIPGMADAWGWTGGQWAGYWPIWRFNGDGVAKQFYPVMHSAGLTVYTDGNTATWLLRDEGAV